MGEVSSALRFSLAVMLLSPAAEQRGGISTTCPGVLWHSLAFLSSSSEETCGQKNGKRVSSVGGGRKLLTQPCNLVLSPFSCLLRAPNPKGSLV